ncbi:KN motif and ankyrin repeat domain-containing protein 4 [Halotydeus destructor]|nr:KN motif and ankyrin repeat domain-containing protein 4 [Halotydeus destructor]
MSVKPVTPNIKRCSCCPYGIHVDNDFIKYCESLLLHVRRTRQVPGPRETKSLPRKAPSLARSDSLSLNCDCSFKTGTSSSSSLASEPYISSTTFSSRSISLPHDDSSLKDAVDRFEEVLLDHNRRSQRSKQRVPDTLQVASAQGNLSSLQLESPPESPASELSTSATTPVSRDYHNGYRTRGVEPNPAPRSFTRPIRSNSIVTGPAAEQIPEDEPIALGKDQEQDESYIPRTLPRLSRRSSILSLKSDKLESPKEDDVFIVQETGYAKKELVDASTITDDYALEKVAINTISIPPSSPSKSDVATFTELVRVVCQATETLPVPVNSASCQTLKSDMKDSDANTESDQFVQAILATCERMTQTIQVESCDAEVHVSSRCTICEMKQSETVSIQVNLSSLDIQHGIKSDHNHNEQVIDVEKQTERLKEERQVEKSPESPKTTRNSNNLIIEDSGDEILVYRDPETIDDEISDVPPNAKHRTLLPQMVDGEFGLNADSGAVSETSESGDEASGQSASKISRSAICENIATNTKEITLEFRAALKVLNDSLQKMDRAKKSATAKSVEIIEKEWFRITGSNNADCGVVEYYLDVFESYSKHLLNYIVNLIDANGNTAMHYAISRSDFDTVSCFARLKSLRCQQTKQCWIFCSHVGFFGSSERRHAKSCHSTAISAQRC